jgi:hypothetical protein
MDASPVYVTCPYELFMNDKSVSGDIGILLCKLRPAYFLRHVFGADGDNIH